MKPITLFCKMIRDTYFLPALFSDRMITCSPYPKTKGFPGLIEHIVSPSASFDLYEACKFLKADLRPEVIVVWADSTRRMEPRNLDAFTCPKVLLVGDTHHQNKPIRNLIHYAASEKFDAVLMHVRAHAHFFIEAGIKNVFWLPITLSTPMTESFTEKKDRELSHIGQTGIHHPNRRRIIEAIYAAGQPVSVVTVPPEGVSEVYAKSQIALSVSLNGDLNLRFFEVPAASGFLLSDKLSDQAGVKQLYNEGEHFVYYDSEEDLISKIKHYLANPKEASNIAKAGHDHFIKYFNKEAINGHLWDIAFNQKTDSRFDLDKEPRTKMSFSSSMEELIYRISIYEYIQEQHRIKETVDILFMPDAPVGIMSDVADLARLNIYAETTGTLSPYVEKTLCEAGVRENINVINAAQATKHRWDIIIAATDHVDTDNRLREYTYKNAIFSSYPAKENMNENDMPVIKGMQPPLNIGVLDMPDMVWNNEEISKLISRYGDVTDLSRLNNARENAGLKNKCVLEIGGCHPKELVIGECSAAQWICIEYRQDTSDYDKEHDGKLIFNMENTNLLEAINEYGIINGSVYHMPDSFNGYFDRIISLSGFNKIRNLPLALKEMHKALRPGGIMYAIFSPIWSSFNGHSLPALKDSVGKQFSFADGENPIPQFAHLTMRQPEMFDYLNQFIDMDTAGKITNYVYNSTHINRLFTEDYLTALNQSQFDVELVQCFSVVDIDENTQRVLKQLHPNRNHFSNNGLTIKLRRKWNEV